MSASYKIKESCLEQLTQFHPISRLWLRISPLYVSVWSQTADTLALRAIFWKVVSLLGAHESLLLEVLFFIINNSFRLFFYTREVAIHALSSLLKSLRALDSSLLSQNTSSKCSDWIFSSKAVAVFKLHWVTGRSWCLLRDSIEEAREAAATRFHRAASGV